MGADLPALHRFNLMTSLKYSAIIRAYEATPLLNKLVQSLRSQSVPPQHIIIVDSSKSDDQTHAFLQMGAKVVPYPDDSFNFSKAINVGVDANPSPYSLIISSHISLEDNSIIEFGKTEADKEGLDVVFWTKCHEERPPETKIIPLGQRAFTGRNGISNSCSLIPTALIRERPFREDVFSAEDQEWTKYYLRRFRRAVMRIETFRIDYLNPNHSASSWSHTKLFNEQLAIGHFVKRRYIGPHRVMARVARAALALMRGRRERASMHWSFARAMLAANFVPPSRNSKYF